MATIDFIGTTTNIGVGSDRKRTPYTGVTVPRQRALTTGGASAPLRGGSLGGRVSFDQPKQLRHSPVKALTNNAFVEKMPLFTKAMADSVSVLEQATFDFQQRQDRADAEQALLIARNMSNDLFATTDSEGNKSGYGFLKGQEAITGYDKYKLEVNDTFEKVGSGLNANARAMFLAHSDNYRTAAQNKGLKRRMGAEDERAADINFQKSQAFKRDLEGGFESILEQFRQGGKVYSIDGDVVAGQSLFEKSLPEGATPEESAHAQMEHYMFTIDSILSSEAPKSFRNSLEAAVIFNEEHQQFNTPDGRAQVDKYLQSKIKAYNSDIKQNQDQAAGAQVAEFSNDMGSFLSSSIVQGDILGFEQIGIRYRELVQATKTVTDDNNMNAEIGTAIADSLITTAEDENSLGPGSGIQLIEDKWSEFIQLTNDNKQPIPGEIREIVRQRFKGYRSDLEQEKKFKTLQRSNAAVGLIGVDQNGRRRQSENQLYRIIGNRKKAKEIYALQEKEYDKFHKGLEEENKIVQNANANWMYLDAKEGKLNTDRMVFWDKELVDGNIDLKDYKSALIAGKKGEKAEKTRSPAESQVVSLIKQNADLWAPENTSEAVMQAQVDALKQLEYDKATSKDPSKFDSYEWFKKYYEHQVEVNQSQKDTSGAWNKLTEFMSPMSPLTNFLIDPSGAVRDRLSDKKPESGDPRTVDFNDSQLKADEFLRGRMGDDKYGRLTKEQLSITIDQLLKSPEYQELANE